MTPIRLAVVYVRVVSSTVASVIDCLPDNNKKSAKLVQKYQMLCMVCLLLASVTSLTVCVSCEGQLTFIRELQSWIL